MAIALALFPSAIGFAQNKAAKPKRQYIQSTAQGTGTQLGRMIRELSESLETVEHLQPEVSAFAEQVALEQTANRRREVKVLQ